MQLIRHLAEVPLDGRRILAIGAFDGVHRGHAAVLQRVVQRARAMEAEPCIALRVGDDGPSLTPLRDRLRLLARHGIARVALFRCGDASPSDIAERFGAHVLVSGRPLSLPSACALELVQPLVHAGAPISTQMIRALLARGDLPAVAQQLGRNASVGGRVVHGFHRGAPLGIPTANLRIRGLVLPPDGVYAVHVRAAGALWPAVTNIGFNPTFGNRTRTVETHVLDFQRDLYGQRIEIEFLQHLRGEEKFADVDALLRQIRDDIAAARRFFAHGSDAR
jgi:riboflavin kinase/FMN adenylyltransferase